MIIIFPIISLVISGVMLTLAFISFKKKEPMLFWVGSAIKSDDLTDIPAYNKANGWMWFVFSLTFLFSGVLGLFNGIIGSTLLLIMCMSGAPLMMICYQLIYLKFKSKEDKK
jgi:hypothetical protein